MQPPRRLLHLRQSFCGRIIVNNISAIICVICGSQHRCATEILINKHSWQFVSAFVAIRDHHRGAICKIAILGQVENLPSLPLRPTPVLRLWLAFASPLARPLCLRRGCKRALTSVLPPGHVLPISYSSPFEYGGGTEKVRTWYEVSTEKPLGTSKN